MNTVQLLGRQPTEADAKRYVSVLQRQTRLLQSMVDDLLDVSRITRGLIELKLKRFDIRDAVESALENVQALMDQKDHDLSVTLPRKAVEVIGDSARLEQVLINLLTNAAKYTDAGGQIAFCLEREEASVKLSVRDNGIGMTADVRERIFDLFGQAERGLARSQGGLGIGLTIVRNLVEQHGGHVDVRSEGLNQGSEFVVMLPLAPAEEASVELVLVQQPQPIPTKGKRVLVVDDNVDIAETLALLLADSGHTVTVAHDGPSALVRAEQDDPQVILLDIGLPGMDGYEVARQLRANPRMRSRALAALTGYGQASDRQLALEAGFNQHFTKPVDIAALEDFVAAPQPELHS